MKFGRKKLNISKADSAGFFNETAGNIIACQKRTLFQRDCLEVVSWILLPYSDRK